MTRDKGAGAVAASDLTVVVVGASGDLARKKILPALFALYCQGFLPARFTVVGFARSKLTEAEFRDLIAGNLTCRYVPDHSCGERMAEFLARCFYVAGEYGARDSFLDLFSALQKLEGQREANRVFYFAIPPQLFLDVAHAVGGAGLVNCEPGRPWSRVVIEKPFGRDRATSDTLVAELGQIFTEEATYRIDHYLGKEVVQNLLVLRFANLAFQPVWHREYIQSVSITWMEDIGIEKRGGYFDSYGIIRDVMQNHLLQILALVAMEPPAKLAGHHIRDEKVRLLRSVPPVTLDDLVVGQYVAGTINGAAHPGYVEDETVPDGSLTPTFAAAVLKPQNERWRGVPFFVRAGKGLAVRKTEITIRFHEVPGNMFCNPECCPPPNELIVKVQPEEGIYFRMNHKVPGLAMDLAQRDLDLRYESAFVEQIPDAYECLLLDVIGAGEKTLFIRSDELGAAWDIFTPVLHELEHRRIVPEPYRFGSLGPDAADTLAARAGLL